jgi:SAM-dependent methyltransferase
MSLAPEDDLWTAHNVRLAPRRYSLGAETIGAAELLSARIIQLAADVLARPFDDLRVLDLACHEGLYGLEFAMHGASVLAIEGREENARKARFAAHELGLGNRYDIVVEDVRELSVERHGTFDIVLCLGILYHLEADDVFRLAEALYATSERLAIIRTAVGLSGRRVEHFGGRAYHGFTYEEPHTAWSSIGNRTSFWPTRRSLLNLLCDVGFTSVLNVAAPPVIDLDKLEDAAVIACLKGSVCETLAASPATASRFHQQRWAEDTPTARSPFQRRGAQLLSRFTQRRYWRNLMRRS